MKNRFLAISGIFLFAALALGKTATVTLVWDPNPVTDQITAYVLYVSTNTAPMVVFAVTTNTTVTLTNIAPGKYTYQVTATNAWGESLASNQVSTPPGNPQKVTNLKGTIGP